jgi:hypothetical protein
VFHKEHATSIFRVEARRERMQSGYEDKSQGKWSLRSMGWEKGDGVITLFATCLHNLTTSLLYSPSTVASTAMQ